MNNLLHLMLAAIEDTPPLLVAPTQLALVRANSNGTSLATGTINPGAGALLVVVVRHRNTAAGDIVHNTPTTTLANLTAFELVEGRYRDAGAASIRTTLWVARTTGATGDGTITAEYAATVNNRMIEVYRVTQGFPAAPVGLHNSAGNNSGSEFGVSYPSAPASASLGFLAFTENQNGTTGTSPTASGWVSLDVSTLGTLHSRFLYKLTGLTTGPHSFTDLPSGLIRTALIAEVLQA